MAEGFETQLLGPQTEQPPAGTAGQDADGKAPGNDADGAAPGDDPPILLFRSSLLLLDRPTERPIITASMAAISNKAPGINRRFVEDGWGVSSTS
jgi:hypothetical protein